MLPWSGQVFIDVLKVCTASTCRAFFYTQDGGRTFLQKSVYFYHTVSLPRHSKELSFILFPLHPGIFGSVYVTYVHLKLTQFLCLPLTSHSLNAPDICHTNHDTIQKQTKSMVCICLTYFAFLYLALYLPSTDPHSEISPLVLDLGQLFSILLQYERVYLPTNPPNLQTIE